MENVKRYEFTGKIHGEGEMGKKLKRVINKNFNSNMYKLDLRYLKQEGKRDDNGKDNG